MPLDIVESPSIADPVEIPVIHAAFVIFECNGDVLFLQRSKNGDHAGEWAFPGGKIEAGESAEEAAKRECREEIGKMPKGDLVLHARKISTGIPVGITDTVGMPSVDATTFVCKVKEKFDPALNDEHTGYAWAPISAAPLPLHPGAAGSLAKFTMTEYDIAIAIRDGELTSPQQFMNLWLFDMRITGTGMSFRSKHGEFVIRDPSLYLNDYFLARCNGLPVIIDHPEEDTLSTETYRTQNVGSVVLPYIGNGVRHAGDEVWGIVKVWDDAAGQFMAENVLSTSPAVVFRSTDGNTSHEIDGAKILIEGRPTLLDHLAVCKAGVWDKGGPPAGIEVVARGDSEVTDKIVADKAIADSVQSMLDAFKDSMKPFMDSAAKISDSVAECNKRMDAFEEEKKADKARRDAEEEEKKKADAAKKDEDEEKAKKDAELAEAAKIADAAKKDAEEDKKADAARLDALVKDHPLVKNLTEQLTSFREQLGRLPAQHTGEAKAQYTDVQLRFDRAYNALGEGAPPPMIAEALGDYRRRLARGIQKHCSAFEKADLSLIADDNAFTPIEAAIINDAVKAAKNPVVEAGRLHPVTKRGDSGHTITEFHGKPGAWMSAFMAPNKATSTMAIRAVDPRAKFH